MQNQFVIRSERDPSQFWEHDWRWTDLKGATIYSAERKARTILPKDGIWFDFEDVKHHLED